MLLQALRTELNSKSTKFIKPTLQPNQKNRILRIIQDDDIDIEKLSAQAARAFSITWIRQIAPGILEYKPQVLTKYARNIPTSKSTPPLSGCKPKIKIQQNDSDDSDESESENLLEAEELDAEDNNTTQAPTQTPTHSNTSAEKKKMVPKPPPPLTQPPYSTRYSKREQIHRPRR